MKWQPDLTHLTDWEWFLFWMEDDAAQLGFELTTYYFLCALMGVIKALVIAYSLGLMYGSP